MRKIKLAMFLVFSLLLFNNWIIAQTKPDIFIRPALYFGGKLINDKAMNEGAKYATPEKPLEISKSESSYQKNGFYYFSGGYFLYLKTPQNTLSNFEFVNQIDYGIASDGIFLFKPKADDKNIVGYSNGAWMIAHHQSIGLKEGSNIITLTLDKSNKIGESEENNNVYKFKVTLKP